MAGFVALDDEGNLLGFVQLSSSPNSQTLGFIIDPALRDANNHIGQELLSTALGFSRNKINYKDDIYLWIPKPTPYHDLIAKEVGLKKDRELFHMRKDISNMKLYPKDDHIVAFTMNKDEKALIELNNRSFGNHPEQGNWDLKIFKQRQRQPWFDPEGLLLYREDGNLGGFCWIKIDDFLLQKHSMGEIYILGIDPKFQGKGIGKIMMKAGLNWLKQQGVSIATLYVDADNKRAIALYKSLGFAPHHIDRAYKSDPNLI